MASRTRPRFRGSSPADLTLAVEVAAPAALTWECATDWARQGEWMFGTRVTSEGEGVGGTIAAFTGRWGVGFLDTMVITGWDPPRVCRVDHTGRLVRGLGVFEVVPRGSEASTFVWTEQLDLPFGALGRAAWPLVRPVFRAGVLASLRRFARWTEGQL
jgi:hypothetical protein